MVYSKRSEKYIIEKIKEYKTKFILIKKILIIEQREAHFTTREPIIHHLKKL